MSYVTKAEFEAALLASGVANIDEPRVERDTEYSYDCYDLPDGEEWGFVSYKSGEEPTYFIRDPE